jgi:hypothetical protein
MTPIAKRTVLSDNACSVLVPILEELFHWNAAQVRLFFESQGLALQEWDKIQTDSITICRTAPLAQIAIQ